MVRTGKRGGTGVVVAVLVVAAACGGSVTPAVGSGGSGGKDGGGGAGDTGVFPDTSVGDDIDASVDAARPDTGSTMLAYDGTTGKACASSSECTPPNGPGLAECSTDVFA
ncbi:MAG TPA: hypothetical protein VHS09_06575, partial [Polyangiaceae bacterium]|nr:hypothetical protein [Polyangiaceae bacterium]